MLWLQSIENYYPKEYFNVTKYFILLNTVVLFSDAHNVTFVDFKTKSIPSFEMQRF
jgi:hypothetical protein